MTARGVVDADGHVMEPMSPWDGLPETQRLRTTRDGYGLDHLFVGNQEIVTVSLGLLGTPGSDMSDRSNSPPLEGALPGGFDPVQRLADMESEGIDTAVLYPSIGLNFWAIEDIDSAVALARAYNDWLAGYCSAAPTRLFGAAMLPMQDPAAAVAELRRAHDELGFLAAFRRPNPCLGRTIAHLRSTRWCCTRCRTRSNRCSRARSSSRVVCSSVIRRYVSRSSKPVGVGRRTGYGASTSRCTGSVAFAPRCA